MKLLPIWLRALLGLRVPGDWSERRLSTDRRSGLDRRRKDIGPPDGVDGRKGIERRTGDRRD